MVNWKRIDLEEEQEEIRSLTRGRLSVLSCWISKYWNNQIDIALRILEKVDMQYDKLIEKEPKEIEEEEGEK